MVTCIVNDVPSDDPLYGLFFQVGGFIYAISRGGFFLCVPFYAQCGHFYARFLRRKDDFGKVLRVSACHCRARVGVAGTGKFWRVNVNAITSLDVNSGQGGLVSAFFIIISYRRFIARVIRLCNGVSSGSSWSGWWCVFRNVFGSFLAGYCLFRQRFCSILFCKGYHVGWNGPASSTRGRRGSRGRLKQSTRD